MARDFQTAPAAGGRGCVAAVARCVARAATRLGRVARWLKMVPRCVGWSAGCRSWLARRMAGVARERIGCLIGSRTKAIAGRLRASLRACGLLNEPADFPKHGKVFGGGFFQCQAGTGCVGDFLASRKGSEGWEEGCFVQFIREQLLAICAGNGHIWPQAD